jgi:hypothetical protein
MPTYLGTQCNKLAAELQRERATAEQHRTQLATSELSLQEARLAAGRSRDLPAAASRPSALPAFSPNAPTPSLTRALYQGSTWQAGHGSGVARENRPVRCPRAAQVARRSDRPSSGGRVAAGLEEGTGSMCPALCGRERLADSPHRIRPNRTVRITSRHVRIAASHKSCQNEPHQPGRTCGSSARRAPMSSAVTLSRKLPSPPA